MEAEQIVRIVWKNHALVLMLSFLLITSPFLPLVLYFFPLIMSTVLCAIALVSIAPHETETELVDRIVGSDNDQQIITSGSSHLLGSYAAWLQWLMGMDHYQIGSDIARSNIPTSSSQEIMCQETTVCGSAAVEEEVHMELTIVPSSSLDFTADSCLHDYSADQDKGLITGFVEAEESSVEEEILMELPIDLPSSGLQFTDSCHDYSAGDKGLNMGFVEAEDVPIHDVAVRKQQLAGFDCNMFPHYLQWVFAQVRSVMMEELKKWLSLLNCTVLGPALRWSRKPLQEKKQTRDLYGCLVIPERITVRLREDPEQRFLKLTDGANEKPALHDHLVQEHLRIAAVGSTSTLSGLCQKEQPALSSSNIELHSPNSSSVCEESSLNSPTDDVLPGEIGVGEANSEDRVADSCNILPDASAMKTITEEKDQKPLISLKAAAFSDEDQEEKPSRKEKLPLRKQRNQLNPKDHELVSKRVYPWPTVQEVLATRTRESTNFPSVMRTGNSLSSAGSSLSTASGPSLRAIKIQL